MKIIKIVMIISAFSLITASSISFGMLKCFCGMCSKKNKKMTDIPATNFLDMTRDEQRDAELRLKEELFDLFEKTEDMESGAQFEQMLEDELEEIYEYTSDSFSTMGIRNDKYKRRKIIGIANLKFLLRMKKLNYNKDNPPPRVGTLDIAFALHTRMLRRLQDAEAHNSQIAQ